MKANASSPFTTKHPGTTNLVNRGEMKFVVACKPTITSTPPCYQHFASASVFLKGNREETRFIPVTEAAREHY